MAAETVLTISVGAVLQGSVMAVLGGAKKAFDSLGSEIKSVTQKHTQLGDAIKKSMSVGPADVRSMVHDYERMGKAIDKATHSQIKLGTALAAQKKASERRQELRGEFRETAGTAAAILAPVGMSVRAYMEQEKAMTDMKIAYMKAGGEVGEAFAEVKRQAIELGNEFPGTTADFLRLGQVLKEQGVKDTAVTGGGLKAAASFNVLMGTSQEAGGEIVAKLMEARGIEDKDLVTAVDQMQRAKFAFGMKPEDLKFAMQYDAPTANMLGLKGLGNQEKLLALQGVGAQVGLEGSSWGTNFSMMLTRMAKGPEAIDNATKGSKAHSKDVISQSGVSFDFFDKSGKFGGVDNMVVQLEKLKTIKDKFGEKQALTVANDMFGMEAGRVAMILADKGKQGFEDNLKKMREQATLQERMAEKSKTLSNAYESFTGTITNGLASVGEVFSGDLQTFFTSANTFISGTLVPWVQNNKELVGTVTKLVGGLLLGKMAFIGLSYGANLLGAPFRAANTALRTFQAGLNIVELVRFGGLSKGAGLLRLFGANAENASKWSASIGKYSGKVFDYGKTLPSKVGGAIKRAPAAVGRGAKRVVMGTVDMGMSAGKGAWRGLGATVNALRHPLTTSKDLVFGLGRALKSIGIGGLRGIGSVLRMAFMPILAIGLPALAIIGAIAGAAFLIYKYWKPIKAFFSGVSQGIRAGLQPLQPLFTAIGAVAGTMFAPLKPVWNWLKGALSGIVGWFGKVFEQEEDVGNGARNMGVRVGLAIAGFINGAVKLGTTVVTKFGQVVSWFQSLPAAFVGFGKSIMQGLLDGILSGAKYVIDAVKSVGSSISSAFTSHPKVKINSPSRVFKSYGGYLMEGLGIGIDSQKSGVLDRIVGLGQGLQKAFAPQLVTPTPTMPRLAVPEKTADTFIGRIGQIGRELWQSLKLSAQTTPVTTRTTAKIIMPAPVMPSVFMPKQSVSDGLIGRIGQIGRDLWQAVNPAAKATEPNTRTPRANVPLPAYPTNQAKQPITIHYNPTIQVNGNGQGTTSVREQIEQATSLGMRELESMIRRIFDEQARRAY